jgi:thiazole synthase
MAAAIRDAVVAGRAAYGAGRIPRRRHAEASTSFAGMIDADAEVGSGAASASGSGTAS